MTATPQEVIYALAEIVDTPSYVARVQGLAAALKTSQDASKQALLDKAQADALMAAVVTKRTEVEQQAVATTALATALNTREVELTRVNSALNEEKDAFESVRQAVDKQHADKEADLAAREAALPAKEAAPLPSSD